MTQVLSISATTAAYAMEAAKPARRTATKDQVRDVKQDAETNEIAKAGSHENAQAVALIPPLTLKMDDAMPRNTPNLPNWRVVNNAYKDND